MSLPPFCSRYVDNRHWRAGSLYGVAGLLLLILAGCSSQGGNLAAEAPVVASDPVARELLAHYRQWRGVPYRFGGENKQGIDCSAFVQRAFRERFAVHLPRTTTAQRRQGNAVAAGHYRPGDLVFFKTGRKSLHVGIYVTDHHFLHASSSNGVILSSLHADYWARRLLEARRVQSLPSR